MLLESLSVMLKIAQYKLPGHEGSDGMQEAKATPALLLHQRVGPRGHPVGLSREWGAAGTPGTTHHGSDGSSWRAQRSLRDSLHCSLMTQSFTFLGQRQQTELGLP